MEVELYTDNTVRLRYLTCESRSIIQGVSKNVYSWKILAKLTSA